MSASIGCMPLGSPLVSVEWVLIGIGLKSITIFLVYKGFAIFATCRRWSQRITPSFPSLDAPFTTRSKGGSTSFIGVQMGPSLHSFVSQIIEVYLFLRGRFLVSHHRPYVGLYVSFFQDDDFSLPCCLAWLGSKGQLDIQTSSTCTSVSPWVTF